MLTLDSYLEALNEKFSFFFFLLLRKSKIPLRVKWIINVRLLIFNGILINKIAHICTFFFFFTSKNHFSIRGKAYKSRKEKGKNLCLMTYESTQNP